MQVLSEPWPQDVAPVIVRRITSPSENGALPPLDELAEEFLHSAEHPDWQSHADASDLRQWEWLMGRIAAKEAVETFLQGVASLSPREVRIATTARGAPYVEAISGAGVIPAISITHSRGIVVAAAGAGTIGIDVEYVDRDISSIERVFTESERSILAAEDLQPIHLMVAKEAAAKATGTGLGGSVQRWPIIGVDSAMDVIIVGRVDHPEAAVPVRMCTVSPIVLGVCAIDSGVPFRG